jgi:hypothetical protein
MDMQPDHAPEPDDAGMTPSASEPPAPEPPAPAPPVQSREDTDVGWGEYRERDDDDWLLRDRPPHWDNG